MQNKKPAMGGVWIFFLELHFSALSTSAILAIKMLFVFFVCVCVW